MRIAAVLVAGAVVWLAAAELEWPARALVTFLLAALPPLMLLQQREVGEVPGTVPRQAVYISSAATIWLLAALAVAAALASGIGPRRLGLLALDAPTLVTWSVGTTFAGLALLALGRALRLGETELLVYLLPRTAAERLGFVGLSLSAGVGEELVFRGFLIPALEAATGSLWLAVVVSSAVFGIVHTYQGASGAVRAGVLGLLLAVPFVATGSVLPSMIAHAALDIAAGLWLADWLLRRS